MFYFSTRPIVEFVPLQLYYISFVKYPLVCKIANDQLILTMDVKVKYSVNVNDVCSKLQGKIFENIEHMTGFQPDQIDIRVSGFMF